MAVYHRRASSIRATRRLLVVPTSKQNRGEYVSSPIKHGISFT